MSAYDEENPLDSFLEMEEQGFAVRRWLVGLISIMGLAAFVGIAWYVYKPGLNFLPDLSIPATVASTAPVAAIQAESDAVEASREESPDGTVTTTAEPAKHPRQAPGLQRPHAVTQGHLAVSGGSHQAIGEVGGIWP